MNLLNKILICAIILFSIILVDSAYSQEKCNFYITKKELKKLLSGYIYNSEDTVGMACLKIFDGRYRYYPIKHGIIEGMVKLYYYDDFIEEITPYKSNKKEGIEKRYFPSGTILRETPYKNNKREGIEKIYYETGGIESEIPYKNDKAEGMRTDYYMDGILYAKFFYKNDYKEGSAKKYYRNGKLKLERVYKQGKKHGFEKEYTDKGILTVESPFKNGSVDGTLKMFDKVTGKPEIFINFINGRKQKAIKYTQDGKIYATINFKNDYIINGTCANGYIFSSKDLEEIQYSIHSIKCGE